MPILRNKTQGNFTMVGNTILNDTRTSLKERGLFTTLCGLKDDWAFSEDGIAKIVKDGRESVHSTLAELEKHGYIKRYVGKSTTGKFETIIELFPEGDAPIDDNPEKERDSDKENDTGVEKKFNIEKCKLTVTEKPSRETRGRESVTENQPQDNTLNIINKSKNNSKECVSVTHTLGNQSLTKDDYDDLVRQYGKEVVDYEINRIMTKPYRGYLRKDIISKWSQEYIDGSNRKVSGGCYPVPSANSYSGGIRQNYDFDALNKFIQDS